MSIRPTALAALRRSRMTVARGLSTAPGTSTPPPPSLVTPTSTGPSSSSSSSSAGSSSSSKAKWLWLSIIPLAGYYFTPRRKPLNPQSYTDHAVGRNTPLDKRHTLISIPLTPAEAGQFAPSDIEGEPIGPETIVIQHVMVKNPALQIERPYTPINVVQDRLDMVVKRVKGGEVGRMVHSLGPKDEVGLRGPIITMALNPAAYDKIVMISTGTGVAPFLQLLSKCGNVSPGAFHLLQAQSKGDDWSAPFIAQQKEKWGDKLVVNRVPPGPLNPKDVKAAVGGTERVLVLVCLPPPLMRPLCGNLTLNLEQGPVTGMLADMGLNKSQVWKLQ